MSEIASRAAFRGLSSRESDWLRHHLLDQAIVPEYQCRFRWRVGSLAFGDNRAAKHHAAPVYYPAIRSTEHGARSAERVTSNECG
nr:TauD/TfdA family dioxygenase [Qipengyuania algicida]